MGYYQGDYYQGDYYSGDPFLGALIGSGVAWLGKKLLGKGAAAAGTKAIAQVGAATTTGLITGGAAGVAIPTIAGAGRSIFLNIRGQTGQPAGTFRPSRILPGGVPAYTPGACPCGYHMNKSMTRSGAPPGTVCVKNRSMNVANPRALRRSLRRVAGFGKLAQRAKKDIKRAAKAIGA